MTTHAVRHHKPDQRAAKRAEPRMPRAPARAPPRADIREDLVARAKRLLAEGYYDNTYALEFAVARMIEDAMSRRATAAPAPGATPGRRAPDTDEQPLARVPQRGGGH